MARTTKGSIKKRGRFFHLDYTVNGKRVRHTLRNAKGDKVTTEAHAEAAADLELRRVTTQDEAGRWRLVQDAVKTSEQVAKEAAKLANRTPLQKVWDKHPLEYATRGNKQGRTRKRRKLAPESITDNRIKWQKFVDWFTGKYPDLPFAEQVTTDHAKEFSAHLIKNQKLSFNRHNKVIYCCGVMLRAATGGDPFKSVDLYDTKDGTKAHEDVPPEDVVEAIKKATGEDKRLLMIGAFTGLRLKDACLLEWGGNISADLCELKRQTSKSGAWVYFDTNGMLAAELANTPPKKRKGYICPEAASEYANGRGWAISKRMSAILSASAAIDVDELQEKNSEEDEEQPDQKRYTFHGLRATFATICAEYGVELAAVQEWLGHSSPAVTRIYQRHRKNRQSGKINLALSDAFKKLLPEGETLLLASEPERAELVELVKAMPIEAVRKVLSIAKEVNATEE